MRISLEELRMLKPFKVSHVLVSLNIRRLQSWSERMKDKIKIATCLLFLILVFGLPACAPKSTQTPPTTAAPEALSMLSAVLSEITGKVEIKQASQDAFT